MQPILDVPRELLDNGSCFTDPFFADLKLRESARPLVVDGHEKDYLFPTLYGDVRCAVGIFHCSWKAARDMASEALGLGVAPPRMLGGRSIVAISCYEYRNVRGVRPYNEIAVALPVSLDGRSGTPVLGAFAAGPQSGYYIAAMPVSSEENRLRGRHFWNLPKVTRRIDIDETAAGTCIVRSYAEDGSPDLELEVPTKGKLQHFDVRSFLASRKDGELLRSGTAFKGDFMVRVRAATILGLKVGAPALKLGSGEASRVLSELRVEPWPLQTRYAASMNSYFDLPGLGE